MTAGVKTWSSAGKSVTAPTFQLIPSGDYELVLDSSDTRIRTSAKPGSQPYVTTMFKVIGTEGANGAPRKVLHALYCSLKPGKDGLAMAERNDGLIAFAHGAGQDTPEFATYDAEDADGNVIEVIDAKEVQEWVKSLDGQTFRGHVTIEKGKDGYGDKNKVTRFEDVLGGGEVQAEEPEEEVYQAPVRALPKPAPKPVAKPATKPAAKVASKRR